MVLVRKSADEASERTTKSRFRFLVYRFPKIPSGSPCRGVPALSFIFDYDKGTDAEKKYREWYNVRYHRPQDDLTQPVDFDAATKFNQFFYRLYEKAENYEKKTEWRKH